MNDLPTPGPHKANTGKQVFRWLLLVVTATGILMIWVGTAHKALVFCTLGHPSAPFQVKLNAAGGVLLVGFWALVASFAYLRAVLRLTGQATKPIPSLAEIELELRRAGYNPSIADVVALHQHLTGQRNEAAFLAGALVVGPHLLAREAQGKPIL